VTAPSRNVDARGARTARAPRTLGLLAVLGAVLCFSISSSIVKWGQTTGSVIAFWRMVGAIGVWWIVIVARRASMGVPPPAARTWLTVLPSGLLFGANLAIFFTAVTKTSIAHAEFIGAVSPLLLVPAGAVLFGEHPNWSALRWGVLSIVGVLIVLAFGPTGGASSLQGDLLVALAVLLWVVYLLFTKRARAGLGVVDFMACVMPIGLLTAGPIALVIAGDEIWPLSTRAWVTVGILTVITGVAAHGLIVFAQHSVPVATIGILQSGQPALAVFWGWLILGEQIRAAQLPGMVLVVVGLALFTLMSQRRPLALPPVAPTPVLDISDG
jgi:drug/metabolite transporter (DMT)-like permease